MIHVIVTGFMGTGKTVVGRKVAQRLGRPFVDMDAEIEARAAKTIPRIFAEDGEAAFRGIEAALCKELCKKNRPLNEACAVDRLLGGVEIPCSWSDPAYHRGLGGHKPSHRGPQG